MVRRASAVAQYVYAPAPFTQGRRCRCDQVCAEYQSEVGRCRITGPNGGCSDSYDDDLLELAGLQTLSPVQVG